MRMPLLFLPLQIVRANLGLAMTGIDPNIYRSAYRQSRIRADLSSVAQCLRGDFPYLQGWMTQA